MSFDPVDFGDDEELYGDRRWRAAAFHQLPGIAVVFRGPDNISVAENPALVTVLDGHNVGTPLREFLVGAEGQGLVEILDTVRSEGRGISVRAARFAVVSPGNIEKELYFDADYVPLKDADDGVVGVLVLARDVTEATLAARAQEAVTADLTRRYQRATDVIEEVQRALLPARLPVLRRVEVAASYVVGGAEQAAGGDWFDLIPRADGTIAAVVGDVVGHGVAASAVMAQLRAVTLERLNSGARPAEVATALDRFVEVLPEGRSATVCVMVLDPVARTYVYCSAGHPPPLMVHAGGSRYLDPATSPPIGDHAGRADSTGHLEPGELVLLYTDGIIERPGTAPMTGTVELARAAEAAAADQLIPAFSEPAAVDRVTTQTLERLTRVTSSVDDITLLAIQPIEPAPDLHIDAEISHADVAGVRSQVHTWLGPHRLAPESVHELDAIITELCDNVADHAYGDASHGPIRLDATLDASGLLHLVVTDRGRWRPPLGPASGRGLGLAIVADLSERMQHDHGDDGTVVTVEYKPWKTSRGTQPATPRTVSEFFDIHPVPHADRTVLEVLGPVDAHNTDELDSQIAVSITPGSPPLTVNLNKATVFASPAVHAVRRRLQQAKESGVEVHVTSKPGTVAHHVFALIGVDTHLPPR